jgi:hypothetical protein
MSRKGRTLPVRPSEHSSNVGGKRNHVFNEFMLLLQAERCMQKSKKAVPGRGFEEHEAKYIHPDLLAAKEFSYEPAGLVCENLGRGRREVEHLCLT